MSTWRPTHRRPPKPSPWTLQATELIDEIVATARCLTSVNAARSQPLVSFDTRRELLATLEDVRGTAWSIADVARSLGMSRQSARQLVVRAAEAGTVQLRPHPRDRRILVVELTAAGSAALRSVRAQQRSVAIVLLNGVELREMPPVVRVLRIVRHRVRRQERERGG